MGRRLAAFELSAADRTALTDMSKPPFAIKMARDGYDLGEALAEPSVVNVDDQH